jgi:chromosome segregation ATPase
MSTTVKLKSFVKEFVAMVKGDEAEAIGEKVRRKAEAGVETRLSSLKGHIVECEQYIEESEENLKHVRLNNGNPIKDMVTYVDNLIMAHKKVDEAKAKLEDVKHTIEVLQKELEIIRS